MMDEMKDVNRQSEIVSPVEESIREMRTKKRRVLLAEARVMRSKTKNIGVSGSELIRVDRDAR